MSFFYINIYFAWQISLLSTVNFHGTLYCTFIKAFSSSIDIFLYFDTLYHIRIKSHTSARWYFSSVFWKIYNSNENVTTSAASLIQNFHLFWFFWSWYIFFIATSHLVCLSISLFISLSLLLSVFLSVFLPISLCLSPFLSLCLSLSLSIYLSISLSHSHTWLFEYSLYLTPCPCPCISFPHFTTFLGYQIEVTLRGGWEEQAILRSIQSIMETSRAMMKAIMMSQYTDKWTEEKYVLQYVSKTTMTYLSTAPWLS